MNLLWEITFTCHFFVVYIYFLNEHITDKSTCLTFINLIFLLEQIILLRFSFFFLVSCVLSYMEEKVAKKNSFLDINIFVLKKSGNKIYFPYTATAQSFIYIDFDFIFFSSLSLELWVLYVAVEGNVVIISSVLLVTFIYYIRVWRRKMYFLK